LTRRYGLTTEHTKIKIKKINHKGHKELKGREARKIKYLRPLHSLRLNHPKGTAIAIPIFVTFVLFVVKTLFLFDCGIAALGALVIGSDKLSSTSFRGL
jgi:hypothetical protein